MLPVENRHGAPLHRIRCTLAKTDLQLAIRTTSAKELALEQSRSSLKTTQTDSEAPKHDQESRQTPCHVHREAHSASRL